MARPTKIGLDYFPMDVDFFQDKKIRLLRGEHGTVGMLVLLATYCRIYSTTGYWATFDADDAILTADELGCGITAQAVSAAMQCAVRRGLFDQQIFERYGVLTSHGIQSRFVMASANRSKIPVAAEYWLLDDSGAGGIPENVMRKIDKRSINPFPKMEQQPQTEKPAEPEEIPLNKYIEQNLFSMSPGNWADLRDLMDDGLSEELVRYGVDKAVGNGKRAWSYTRSILNNWLVKGFKTVEDAKNEFAQPQPSQPQQTTKSSDKPVKWI